MPQLFFVKPPVPGKVKTRLASYTGPERAVEIYCSMLRMVLPAFESGGILYLSSPDETGFFEKEFPSFPVRYQIPGDLGSRMASAFLQSFQDDPSEPVLLTGSDIPGYNPEIARKAIGLLNRHDAVLIPSGDGGYSMIGLRPGLVHGDREAPGSADERESRGRQGLGQEDTPAPTASHGNRALLNVEFKQLFQGIAWSTPEVLESQLDRFNKAGLDCVLMEPLNDLDDAEDLYRFHRAGLLGQEITSIIEDLPRIALLIPVFNEVENLAFVLGPLKDKGIFTHIVCADNGSTDGSTEKALELGALVSECPRRGYGSTCLKGMELLEQKKDWDILVFMDGDGSDDPSDLLSVLSPVASGEADLCLGARVKGVLLPHQKFGNWLATVLIRIIYGHKYRDLGPFRAIRREALSLLQMDDPDFGWTVQMQIRAVQKKLRIQEVPVNSRKRHAGRSKVSATIRGSFLAGWIILRTVGREFLLNKKDSRH